MRFVTTRIDADSHRQEGVFMAAYALLDSGDLTKSEWKHVREILDWFREHLPTPPDKFTACRAVFWFKSNAEESIKNIWELVHVLRDHGYYIEVHKCRRLGNVLYQDKYQVAAFPSKNDGRITVQ
ncbi:MAG TPA: hypothetical protein VGL89_16375 [Candidatus Koribacter sp.]